MKTWPADHPKAKLMARKRGDILAAAKASFLERGYAGSSMEAIARDAGVSIMTLYRHAETKDDLFAAVIAMACDPDSPEEAEHIAQTMKLPLGEILMEAGRFMRGMLLGGDTVTLLRVTMAEATRFPQLARLAHDGLIGRLETVAAEMVGAIPETAHLPEAERKELGRRFIDALVGTDLLRLLLGMPGPTESENEQHVARARDLVLAELGKMPRL